MEDVKTFRDKIEELYNINYDPSNIDGLAYLAETLGNTTRRFGGSGKTYFPLPELQTDRPQGARVVADTEMTARGATTGAGVADIDTEDAVGTGITKGHIKMVKMAFGFKQIPKDGSGTTSDHRSDGYIRITPVGGLQTLPNGENATSTTAAAMEQICSPHTRDKSDSTGFTCTTIIGTMKTITADQTQKNTAQFGFIPALHILLCGLRGTPEQAAEAISRH